MYNQGLHTVDNLFYRISLSHLDHHLAARRALLYAGWASDEGNVVEHYYWLSVATARRELANAEGSQ